MGYIRYAWQLFDRVGCHNTGQARANILFGQISRGNGHQVRRRRTVLGDAHAVHQGRTAITGQAERDTVLIEIAADFRC